jgi:UDP-glucose:(heptosyl)LPS alpha-1,3-glucosyltransferase
LIADADLMLHPARSEAGQVIGEALLAGVPALVSGACLYAEELERCGSGIVLPEPFEQRTLVAGIATMIGSLPELRKRAADYAPCLHRERESWLALATEWIERRV